jgi:fumarate reductase subunit C
MVSGEERIEIMARLQPLETPSQGPTLVAAPSYTRHHPRWYRTRVSVFWWLGKPHYLKFILRELSSVFIAAFVVITVLQLRTLGKGPEAYARFAQWLRDPAILALNFVSLFFVVFHAVTWFNLTPHAMPNRIRGQRIPAWALTLPNYAAWIVVSCAIAWVLLS